MIIYFMIPVWMLPIGSRTETACICIGLAAYFFHLHTERIPVYNRSTLAYKLYAAFLEFGQLFAASSIYSKNHFLAYLTLNLLSWFRFWPEQGCIQILGFIFFGMYLPLNFGSLIYSLINHQLCWVLCRVLLRLAVCIHRTGVFHAYRSVLILLSASQWLLYFSL